MNEHTTASLDAVFQVEPTTELATTNTTEVLPTVMETASLEETPEERQAKEDFEFSRGAIKTVAIDAQNTLHRAVEVAEQTDTPRAFEAVADMVRATLESHRELQSLHKTAAEIRLATKTAQIPANQVLIDKGIVFNGSPDELLKLIDPSRQ